MRKREADLVEAVDEVVLAERVNMEGIALSGARQHNLLRQVRMVRFIVMVMGFAIAAWGWKILIHLNGWDGWR